MIAVSACIPPHDVIPDPYMYRCAVSDARLDLAEFLTSIILKLCIYGSDSDVHRCPTELQMLVNDCGFSEWSVLEDMQLQWLLRSVAMSCASTFL